MRVAVLGGTGYIGRAIVAELVRNGDDVLVVHRGEIEPPDLPRVEHLHASREFVDLPATFDGFVDVRAMSRAEAEQGVRAMPAGARAVVLSSMDVYRAYTTLLDEGPATDRVPFDETAPVRTKRYPFRSMLEGRGDDYEKLDVEETYLVAGATILRLPMVYGEHDRQRREEFILRRVRAGRKQIPFGPGTWLTSRGYVGDVAKAVRLALAHRDAGEIFNICESRTQSVRRWAEDILDVAGADLEFVRVPDALVPDDLEDSRERQQHFLCDGAKARYVLGFTETDPREALRRSVRWHLANPPTSKPDFSADDRALVSGQPSSSSRRMSVRGAKPR